MSCAMCQKVYVVLNILFYFQILKKAKMSTIVGVMKPHIDDVYILIKKKGHLLSNFRLSYTFYDFGIVYGDFNREKMMEHFVSIFF